MRAPYVINRKPVPGDAPRFPPPQVLCNHPLGDIALAPLADEHFDALFTASHGDGAREAIWKYLPYGRFADAFAMRAHYQSYRRASEENQDPQFYAVIHGGKEDASPIAGGVVSYLRINPSSRSIEIGHIWHATAQQKTRANTCACFLLMDNAFALGYRRVEWKCDAANARSRAAALRLGFAFEGVFRKCTLSKNKNRDTAWFAILDDDWPLARANLIAWLSEQLDGQRKPGQKNKPASKNSLSELNRPLVAWSLPAHDEWPPPAE